MVGNPDQNDLIRRDRHILLMSRIWSELTFVNLPGLTFVNLPGLTFVNLPGLTFVNLPGLLKINKTVVDFNLWTDYSPFYQLRWF